MSGRPLLITDCDEVLLHMVGHFRTWLDEAHALDFSLASQEFGRALTRRDGSTVALKEVWPLLDGFFPAQMHRQTLVPDAAAALERIAQVADIVVLTNLGEHCQPHRVAQLDAFGIRHRVVCNQGGKGPPVARLIAEHAPSVTVFVDDLGVHHASVAADAPQVWRLHMVAEPELAPNVPKAAAAHARIDGWQDAADWIVARFAERLPAD